VPSAEAVIALRVAIDGLAQEGMPLHSLLRMVQLYYDTAPKRAQAQTAMATAKELVQMATDGMDEPVCSNCGSLGLSQPPKLDLTGRCICSVCARELAGNKCRRCERPFNVADYPRSAIDVKTTDHGPYRGFALCLSCTAEV
jgi:hypothetical protein